ncbi:hypothetical protein SK128_019857, partial [Halocaridina rubra]
VFHICQAGNRQDAFLCPNGSIFNQQYFVCDWWFNFDCSSAEQFFGLNADIGKVDDGSGSEDANSGTATYGERSNANEGRSISSLYETPNTSSNRNGGGANNRNGGGASNRNSNKNQNYGNGNRNGNRSYGNGSNGNGLNIQKPSAFFQSPN